jgi:hypothetical protein
MDDADDADDGGVSHVHRYFLVLELLLTDMEGLRFT